MSRTPVNIPTARNAPFEWPNAVVILLFEATVEASFGQGIGATVALATSGRTPPRIALSRSLVSARAPST
ncbi:hypothetical protein HYQ46_005662 [Verticillium longisporum]|nr:hypothetical protein HYQ46_005662 [Verticillium longisporum]